MDLSFSKVEPFLRSFQHLARGPEQDLVDIGVLRLLMATATTRAHVSAGTARAYDVRNRSAIPAHWWCWAVPSLPHPAQSPSCGSCQASRRITSSTAGEHIRPHPTTS